MRCQAGDALERIREVRDAHAGDRRKVADAQPFLNVALDVLHRKVGQEQRTARTAQRLVRRGLREDVAQLGEQSVAEHPEIGVVRPRPGCAARQLPGERDDHVVHEGDRLAITARGQPCGHAPRAVEIDRHALADPAQGELRGHARRDERHQARQGQADGVARARPVGQRLAARVHHQQRLVERRYGRHLDHRTVAFQHEGRICGNPAAQFGVAEHLQEERSRPGGPGHGCLQHSERKRQLLACHGPMAPPAQASLSTAQSQ